MNLTKNVNVGILKANLIQVVFHREYTLGGKSFVGECTFTLEDAGKFFEPSSTDASFTIKDVVIGISFHWQRTENQTFLGGLKFVEEDGMLRAVNVVPVETYLASVISSEMSAKASLELLKAHSVISRSWLLKQMEHEHRNALGGEVSEDRVVRWYDSEGHALYDVCADDHCQRYQGITRQTSENVLRAIEATRGEVLMCDGKICDARFSKCCGGILETFENCWQPVHYRYLIAKPDPYCNTSDKAILAQVLNNYDQETIDFYRWTVTYSASEISEIVKRKSGIDFGRILDLVPEERGESGRIVVLKIIGEKRSIRVGKELEIRKWLSDNHLYSSAFDVEKVVDDEGKPCTFILHGKGWGHGVGLCQIGAAVMGIQGFNYRDILSYYYPNTQVKALW